MQVVFEVSELNEQPPTATRKYVHTPLLHCGSLTSDLAKLDILEHLTYINSYVIFTWPD